MWETKAIKILNEINRFLFWYKESSYNKTNFRLHENSNSIRGKLNIEWNNKSALGLFNNLINEEQCITEHSEKRFKFLAHLT